MKIAVDESIKCLIVGYRKTICVTFTSPIHLERKYLTVENGTRNSGSSIVVVYIENNCKHFVLTSLY